VSHRSRMGVLPDFALPEDTPKYPHKGPGFKRTLPSTS
jgi:hypothetical protein